MDRLRVAPSSGGQDDSKVLILISDSNWLAIVLKGLSLSLPNLIIFVLSMFTERAHLSQYSSNALHPDSFELLCYWPKSQHHQRT